MSNLLKTTIFAVALAVAGCGAKSAETSPATASTVTATPRPTEPFRREHAELHEHLRHVTELAGSLVDAGADEQRRSMREIVEFMEHHIVPHAEWEERVLYPAVDRRAASGPNPFTASMRWEHRIVGRWTHELAEEAAKPTPDAKAFARRADNLFGLVQAHFESEEEVLLPILDRTMTKDDFDREIGAHGG